MTPPAWHDHPEIPEVVQAFLNLLLTEMNQKELQMAKGKLFTYAVIFHPKPTRDAGGNDTTLKSEILIKPTDILASDPETVGKIATRAIDKTYEDKLEQVEIIVRPFN